jgi:DcmR-like sensory protein
MEHAGFQHQALIYEGADEYLAGTMPFLREGLEAGEPALVAVCRARARLLEGELGSEAERIRFLPIEEVGRNPALLVSLWRDFVDGSGGRSVRGSAKPPGPSAAPRRWRSAAATTPCSTSSSGGRPPGRCYARSTRAPCRTTSWRQRRDPIA